MVNTIILSVDNFLHQYSSLTLLVEGKKNVLEIDGFYRVLVWTVETVDFAVKTWQIVLNEVEDKLNKWTAKIWLINLFAWGRKSN